MFLDSTFIENQWCFHKIKLAVSFSSLPLASKALFICFYNLNFNKETIGNQQNRRLIFLKLVLRAPKTVLRNKKKLIFKNRLKHLKRKCFNVLRQNQSCSHGVKNGCKNLQRFSLKPFCLSSERAFTTLFTNNCNLQEFKS